MTGTQAIHLATCSRNGGFAWTQVHLCNGNRTLRRYCCDGRNPAERRHPCDVSGQL